MARIVLGVAGGIAAYKACELLRRLREGGHDVTVVPTPNALAFVGETTWAALAGHPIRTTVWEEADEVPHVSIGRMAELVIVAPATADLLARAATGRADDLLTNLLLTATCPVVMAPAMHTEMWHHPATQANVATLRERGVVVIQPASGRLTGKDSGPGRLPEPVELFAIVESVLAEPASAQAHDLAGLRLVVSAGGTREPIDGVRFLANSSSGKMGVALARSAALRGAEVTLIAGSVDVPLPGNVTVQRVETTAQLGAAMRSLAPCSDIVVMAAAPADFTAAHPTSEKIKKDGSGRLLLELVETEDVLASLVNQRIGAARPVLVGFAAETAGSPEKLREIAAAKRQRKGCDLIVANDVAGGAIFGSDDTTISILGPAGLVAEMSGTKTRVAHAILDAAVDYLA